MIALSFCTTIAAVARRVNHLRSAGTTYHGARRMLVRDSIVSKAY